MNYVTKVPDNYVEGILIPIVIEYLFSIIRFCFT